MWRKEEGKAPGRAATGECSCGCIHAARGQEFSHTAASSSPATSAALPVSREPPLASRKELKSKAKLSARKIIFVDGTLEGKLDIGNAIVTFGPNGKVKADISGARNCRPRQVTESWTPPSGCSLGIPGEWSGEVRTERLAIEDGAVLREKVEAGKANRGPARVATRIRLRKHQGQQRGGQLTVGVI